MWENTWSMERPISLAPTFSNSSFFLANPTNSVVQTGVKSAGWLNSTIHLPATSLGRFIMPWVVLTTMSGNLSPIRGKPMIVSSHVFAH